MTSIDDVTTAATAYGQTQYAQGKADQALTDAAALATAQQQISDLASTVTVDQATMTDLEAQLAAASGEPPDGYTVPNAGADLQKAIDAGPAYLLPSTKWPLTAKQILLSDGAALWGGPGATLVRTIAGGDGTRASLFANRSWKKAIQGATLRGFTLDANHVPGGTFGLWVNDLMHDVTGLNWLGGKYGMVFGDNHRVNLNSTCDLKATSGAAGWRDAGGNHSLVTGFCQSGDDTLQVVSAGDPTDPLWGLGDAVDRVYRGVTGRSLTSRFLIAKAQDKDNDGTDRLGMSCSIEARFEDCHGFGGGTAAAFGNSSSSGHVSVVVVGCTVDQSLASPTKGQPSDVYIESYSGLGLVTVDLSGGLQILHPRTGRKLQATAGTGKPTIVGATTAA